MPSNTALMDEIDRSSKRERRFKDKVAAKSEEIIGYGGVVIGGAAGGYIDAKWPKKKLVSVGLPMAVGFGALIVGVGDWGGKSSHFIGSVGAGLLGAEAYKIVFDKTDKASTSGMVGAAAPKSLPQQRMSVDEMRSQLADLARVAA